MSAGSRASRMSSVLRAGPPPGLYAPTTSRPASAVASLTIIRRMVADLCLRVEIVGAPTVRESDGLAMSSRNQYLDEAQRALAPSIYRQLQQAVIALKAGERDFAKIEAAGRASLDGIGFRTDYFSVRDARSLLPATPDTRHFVVLVASRLGKARLIDNVQYGIG